MLFISPLQFHICKHNISGNQIAQQMWNYLYIISVLSWLKALLATSTIVFFAVLSVLDEIILHSASGQHDVYHTAALVLLSIP